MFKRIIFEGNMYCLRKCYYSSQQKFLALGVGVALPTTHTSYERVK